MKRFFEFVGEDASRGVAHSAKFWETWVEGASLYTRFGKIGANGQTTVKEFASSEKAEEACAKAIGEKLKKGYQERGAGGDTSSPPKNKVTVEQEARELIDLCLDPGTSALQIDEVISSHFNCAEAQEHCKICARLWSQDEKPARDLGLDDSIWTALSRRPDLTAEQQNQVFLAGVNEGPDAALLPSIVPNLVRNAVVFPEDLGADLLDIHAFVGSILWDDYGSFASDLVRGMRANPAFPAEFIDEFISAHDDLNYDFDFDSGNSAAPPTPSQHDSVSAGPGAALGNCKECDSAVGAGAKFCPECGAQQRRIAFCSECGVAREGNGKFCGECGTAYE